MLQQPWLCVSPDGLIIYEDQVLKILEVKCPYSCKTKSIFVKNKNKYNVPYLYCEQNVIKLVTSHKYYTQVQMLMYATGMMECDFYVWSPCGSCLVNVHRDEIFLNHLLTKLHLFYFEFFLPGLFKNQNSSINENFVDKNTWNIES